MKVLATYNDGSRTVLYEPGDRVRLTKVHSVHAWLAKVGDLATVKRRERPRSVYDSEVGAYVEGAPSPIDFLQVQTDEMRAGGWGVLTIPPWHVEFVDE